MTTWVSLPYRSPYLNFSKMIPARGPQTKVILTIFVCSFAFAIAVASAIVIATDEQSWNRGYWQLGLGSLRYPRYPGGDEQSCHTGYWQLGLGSLRYPRYPGGDEQSCHTGYWRRREILPHKSNSIENK